MDVPIQIFKFHYRMELCGGYQNDTFRYHGECPDHPTVRSGNVSPSAPVEFDEANMLLRTVSGRLYKIMSFDADPVKTIAQIKDDIERGGFQKC